MVFVEVAATAVALLVTIIIYFKWSYTFWERRGIPTLQPHIPFGTIGNPFKRQTTFGEDIRDTYLHFKSKGYKCCGTYAFSSPEYMPLDLELIKDVLQRDFQYFMERGVYYNEKDDPLSANLFTLGGHKWKILRAKMTPTFTSGKMKMMFDIVVECSKQMLKAVDTYCVSGQGVDIKDILACFTTDVIGSCAFGLECNSFKNPDAEFRRYGKSVFNMNSTWHFVKLAIAFSNFKVGRRLGIRLFPQDSTEFFQKVVNDAVEFRKKNKIIRKDMLQLLIDLMNEQQNEFEKDDNNTHDTKGLTMEEIAAQAFIFFLAGFETSSTAMTFCLYELSKNPYIQQRLREEINQVLNDHEEKLAYASLSDMKYLGRVLDETLRKYPPLAHITRECAKDYTVPHTNIIIPKGVTASISIMGVHYDPENYPHPEIFDPERFTEEKKQKRHPFAYIPFGQGPRMCIGLRFGIMQAKIGLVNLLKQYSFSLNKKTVDPIVMDPYGSTLSSEGGIFLNVENVQ